MIELGIGQEIELEYGGVARITGIVGNGVRDKVYNVSYNGTEWVLKWYDIEKLKNPDEIYNNLKVSIADGSPNNKFVWPKYVTKKTVDGSFGFIMEKKPDSFDYLTDILKAYKLVNESETGRVTKKTLRFSSLFSMATAALNVVNAFRKLHQIDKCYQYLDDGGFFINVDTGATLSAGCDNVAPIGSEFGVVRRTGYTAPEVILGEAPSGVQSDRYMLATALFKLLFRGDPLEGKKVVMDVCLTDEEMLKHYSSDAVFVFDPDNDSNRPVRGIHDNVIKFWESYPTYIKEAFVKAFTEGLRDPEKRLTENDWQTLLMRMRSETIQCSMCGKTNFAHLFEKSDSRTYKCMNCLEEIPTIVIGNRKWRTPLYKGAKIYECDIHSDSNDFLTVAGEVVENKFRPGLYGIKNCSERKWSAKMPDGVVHDVEPGKGFPIWQGLEIDFGEVKAKA